MMIARLNVEAFPFSQNITAKVGRPLYLNPNFLKKKIN